MKRPRHFIAAGVTACGLLVTAAAGFNAAVSMLKLHLRKQPIQGERQTKAIPKETESWVQYGPDQQDSGEILKELGTFNTVARTFVEKQPKDPKKPRLVDLHLPYYTGQVDTVPHVAERCMVGAGWDAGTTLVGVTLDDSSWRRCRRVTAAYPGHELVSSARLSNRYSEKPGQEVRLPLDLVAPAPGKDEQHRNTIELRVTEFVHQKTGAKTFIGYFFIANGRLATSAEQVRSRAFDLKADYAYYLKVQVGSPTATSVQELADTAQALLSEMLPEIMLCVPDWVDVEMRKIEGTGKASGKEEGVGHQVTEG